MLRAHKFNAISTEYNGRKYASKAEARRAYELDILKRSGSITLWFPQVSIDIGEPNVDRPYRVDFLVISLNTGEIWAEDVKGVETASFRRHIRQWRKNGPCDLHVISCGRSETIVGGKHYEQQNQRICEECP